MLKHCSLTQVQTECYLRGGFRISGAWLLGKTGVLFRVQGAWLLGKAGSELFDAGGGCNGPDRSGGVGGVYEHRVGALGRFAVRGIGVGVGFGIASALSLGKAGGGFVDKGGGCEGPGKSGGEGGVSEH